jgi:hypothetical protein
LVGAEVGAGEAGFVTVEEFKFGLGGEGGEGGADGLSGGEMEVGGEGGVEEVGLGGPGAEAAPGGDGHFLDAEELVSGAGLELVGEGVEVVEEGLRGLDG